MLNLRTGRLWRSLSPDGLTQDQKRELKISKDGSFEYTIESLLPYAEIHDTGGFIKATPVTVIRKFNPNAKNKVGGATRFQTFQMARYFWAMFFKHGNTFYRAMALHVHNKGGITIKATKYFTKAVKEFRKTFRENQIILSDDIAEMINNSPEINVLDVAKMFKEFAEGIPNDFSIAVANNMKNLKAADAKRLNDPLTATWKG